MEGNTVQHRREFLLCRSNGNCCVSVSSFGLVTTLIVFLFVPRLQTDKTKEPCGIDTHKTNHFSFLITFLT